ncbi:hypothetical protein [Moorena producens]
MFIQLARSHDFPKLLEFPTITDFHPMFIQLARSHSLQIAQISNSSWIKLKALN